MRKAHGKGLVVGAGGETSVAAKIVRLPLVEFSTIKNLVTVLMIGQCHGIITCNCPSSPAMSVSAAP